jgi:dTMP kinase
MMVAARAQHCAEVIEPALAQGQDVVCDRFDGSTIAYQGFGRGLPVVEVRAACEIATAGLVADLTVLLDLPIEIAAHRRSGPVDVFESAGADFYERVREGFLVLAATTPGWVVIDGDDSVEAVAEAVWTAVDAHHGSLLQ